MEYVEGENFWQRVSRQGVLSEAEALLYIRQIGSPSCRVGSCGENSPESATPE